MPGEQSARSLSLGSDQGASSLDRAPWSIDATTNRARDVAVAACSSERHERRALELARQSAVKSALDDLRRIANELDADAWMYRSHRPSG